MRNHGRFARRIRPVKRGWQYQSTLPRDGRSDRVCTISSMARAPIEERVFWNQTRRKLVLRLDMLKRGKIRFWIPLSPKFVTRRNDAGW